MRKKLEAPLSVLLKVVSAIGIDGRIARPGAFIEVMESEAKILLQRGKVKIPTEDELREANLIIENEEDDAKDAKDDAQDDAEDTENTGKSATDDQAGDGAADDKKDAAAPKGGGKKK